jgi:hypothetical protein
VHKVLLEFKALKALKEQKVHKVL